MHSRRRIKFIYAGGTIGMMPNGHGCLIVPGSDEDFKRACLPTIQNWQRATNFEVDYEFLTSKDSSNMTPYDWSLLIDKALQAQEQQYDALVIAHGTDTLVYSASALAFGFHERNSKESSLKIPIVLTGGQNSVFQFGGDGQFNLQNLFRTAQAAIEAEIADVMINFGYQVLLGSRTVKVSERAFTAFESPSERGRVGFIDAYGVHLDASKLRRRKKTGASGVLSNFSDGILVIDIGPGTEPKLLEGIIKNGGIKAMVLKSPGEGNICTEGTYNLLPFVSNAVRRYGIPILIASKFLGGAVGRANYEIGRAALDAGAIACHDTNDCAVEVKIRWLLGNELAKTIEDVKEAMSTSFAGEVSV